jgi:hypothetical protein
MLETSTTETEEEEEEEEMVAIAKSKKLSNKKKALPASFVFPKSFKPFLALTALTWSRAPWHLH